jgi:formylglycine-generating enzyme required for sulfatase activity
LEDTTPVGQFSPRGDSPYGCVDMAGNVWEWVNDWYAEDYYQTCVMYGSQSNPTGPEEGNYRVVRGGSWDYNPVDLRVASRSWKSPGDRVKDLGFRCVCSK